MGGSACMSLDTISAASGPLATSRLMSKLKPLSTSVNFTMGTLAFAMICVRGSNQGLCVQKPCVCCSLLAC